MYLPEIIRKYTADKEPNWSRPRPAGWSSLSRFHPTAQSRCAHGHGHRQGRAWERASLGRVGLSALPRLPFCLGGRDRQIPVCLAFTALSLPGPWPLGQNIPLNNEYTLEYTLWEGGCPHPTPPHPTPSGGLRADRGLRNPVLSAVTLPRNLQNVFVFISCPE